MSRVARDIPPPATRGQLQGYLCNSPMFEVRVPVSSFRSPHSPSSPVPEPKETFVAFCPPSHRVVKLSRFRQRTAAEDALRVLAAREFLLKSKSETLEWSGIDRE